MNGKINFDTVIKTIENFLESLHECESPFEFATTLVKATAEIYKADTATLFRVTPSRTELIAEAGYDKKGQLLKSRASYSLDWEAKSESDMSRGGLTAWVAVSGKPLFVRDLEELLKHPARKGTWANEFYPEGLEKAFGCLYAVPLMIGGDHRLTPKESVLGVYKIQRRKDNPEGIFTGQQIMEFNLAVKQISLVILLYERAMARVLSDARHAVSGRLADAIQQLRILKYYLDPEAEVPPKDRFERLDVVDRVIDDSERVNSWLRQSMEIYSNPLEIQHHTLLDFVNDTVEARKVQDYSVEIQIPQKDRNERICLTVAESWDLHTLLLSLLNNAMFHSGRPETVKLKAEINKTMENGGTISKYIFTIEDRGKGIPDDIIEKSRLEPTAYSTGQIKGTGLKRVFRVGQFREWEIIYKKLNPGAKFKVIVTGQEVK